MQKGTLQIHSAAAETALGKIGIAATPRGICFLMFASSNTKFRRILAEEFPQAKISAMPKLAAPRLKQWMAALNPYLQGKSRLAKLPLDIQGTAFQKRVWRYLQTIPAGEVRAYAQVAKAIGRPGAVRAVASACARNRIALAIPCHRVIRGDGSLAGYRWGAARKRALIDLENKR